MPSRDLVVQVQELKREVDHLHEVLGVTRQWQAFGIPHAFTVNGVTIPMSKEHAEILDKYVKGLEKMAGITGNPVFFLVPGIQGAIPMSNEHAEGLRDYINALTKDRSSFMFMGDSLMVTPLQLQALRAMLQ